MTRAVDVFMAEAHKTVLLPATWAAAAGTTAAGALITTLNARGTRQALETANPDLSVFTSVYEAAYSGAPLFTVGAVCLGVTMVSSEYVTNRADGAGAKQIVATLAVCPQRWKVFFAKVTVLTVLVACLTSLALGINVGIATLLLQGAPTTSTSPWEMCAGWAGACIYTVFMAWIACGCTFFFRSGAIPMVILLVNSSLVPFTYLLTKVTPLAFWLPDIAGRGLFTGLVADDEGLSPLIGGVVMAMWTVALLATAGWVFQRRDA